MFSLDEIHRLPAHPLFQRGYRSIGGSPCTIPIGLNEDERAGRWKIECGLHTEMFQHKDVAELKSDFRIEPTEVKE